MARARLAGFAGVLVVGVLVDTGCSTAAKPGGEAVACTVGGVTQGMSATTVNVVNVAMQTLHNVSGCSVRLRGVSLVSVPSAVQVTSVTACLDGTNNIGMGPGTC